MILSVQKNYSVRFLYEPLFAIVILSFSQLMVSNIKSKLDTYILLVTLIFLFKIRFFTAKSFYPLTSKKTQDKENMFLAWFLVDDELKRICGNIYQNSKEVLETGKSYIEKFLTSTSFACSIAYQNGFRTWSTYETPFQHCIVLKRLIINHKMCKVKWGQTYQSRIYNEFPGYEYL